MGLCLGNQDLASSQIQRRAGAEDIGWLDEIS
jgi:hypothetical protein